MIKANEESIYYISGNKKFVVPFFQRKYVWTEENWSDLWDALMSDDETIFLGSLILKDNGVSNDINELSVIDGQQRLTTISILVRAINDGFINANNDEIDEYCKKILFNTSEKWIESENGNLEKITSNQIKLVNSEYDRKYYEDVITGKYKNSYNSFLPYNEKKQRIISCYAFFMSKITEAVKNKEHDKLQKNLISKLQVDSRKLLVIITIDNSDHEQEIFDTINSAGVRLTSSDIIKNNLFNSIVELLKKDNKTKDNVIEQTKKIYEDTWHKIFEKDEDTTNKWLKKISKGRRERTYLDLFLQSFAIIKQIYNPTEKGQKLDKISEYFKKYCANFDLTQLKQFLSELCEYAKIYSKYFIDGKENIIAYGLRYKENDLTDDDNEIKHILQMLIFMETNTFDAYILKVIKDNDDVKNKLFELETYLMRNYITQQNTDKNYNKESYDIMFSDERDVNYYLTQNNLEDATIINSLSKIKNDPAKLILMWVELYMTHEQHSDNDLIKAVKDSYQLEHVLPQSYTEDKWPIYYDTTDMKGNKLPDYVLKENHDNAIREMDELKFKIGNMTLLTGKKNAEFQNESFKNKKNGFRNKKGKQIDGYKKCSKLMITSFINDAEDWNEDTINERTKIIAELVVKKLWPIDKTIFVNNSGEQRNTNFDNVSQNNDAEDMYSNLTTGKLAYTLISKLLNENIIDAKEVKELTTKEYSKSCFKKVTFPVLAYNRTDNMGGGSKIRYCAKPVKFEGVDYYISLEWFKESRSDLIKWYKNHL